MTPLTDAELRRMERFTDRPDQYEGADCQCLGKFICARCERFLLDGVRRLVAEVRIWRGDK